MSTLVTKSPPTLLRIVESRQTEEFIVSGLNLEQISDSQSVGVSVNWFIKGESSSHNLHPILSELLEAILSESNNAKEAARIEGISILEKAEGSE